MTVDAARKCLEDYAAKVAACELDEVVAFYSDDALHEDLAMQDKRHGKAEIGEFYTSWHKALKNDYYRFSVECLRVFSDGGFALEYDWHARVDSSVTGLPDSAIGRTFQIRGVGVGVVKDGKIAVWRDYYDALSVLAQLGFKEIPSPE